MARLSKAFGALLREIVEGKGLRLRDAAHRTGFSHTTIRNWMGNEVPVLPDSVRELADGLDVPRVPLLLAAEFMPRPDDERWDEEHYSDPLLTTLQAFGTVIRQRRRLDLGTVPAGVPEDREAVYRMAREAPYDYLLTVIGDSMEPVFHAGDRVIVRPDQTPQIGDYVVATANGHNCLKQVTEMKENGERILVLHSVNGKYKEIRSDQADITIQGVVAVTELHVKRLHEMKVRMADLERENEDLRKRLHDGGETG